MSRELQQIADKATPLVEGAIHSYLQHSGVNANRTLRSQVCGLASAVLGTHLADEYGIETDQYIAVLQAYPRTDGYTMTHVLLRERQTGATIDPSYTQFLGLVGLSQYVLDAMPALERFCPASKIAVIDKGEELTFGIRYAEYAIRVAPSVRTELGRTGVTLMPPMGSLLQATDRYVHQVYDSIWTPGLYQPYARLVDEDAERTVTTCLARAKALY
ncbi:hypothetical protein IPM09_01745 [Candidatus Saccharibacteria bacterium]|nr:MAG: hypothetical protein IPM09_01745 [Candidatus Saccharibacteria bacterium]